MVAGAGRWSTAWEFAITETVRDAITLVPKKAWTPALDADGDVREHADVVEITGLLPGTLREAWLPGCGSSSAVNTPTPAPRYQPFRGT